MNTAMARARGTFSITMANGLKEALDNQVRSRRFLGRSHAIEYYVKQAMEEEEKIRKLKEERERSLSKILEKDVEKIEYLLDFLEALEQNPELLEQMKAAVQACRSPEP